MFKSTVSGIYYIKCLTLLDTKEYMREHCTCTCVVLVSTNVIDILKIKFPELQWRERGTRSYWVFWTAYLTTCRKWWEMADMMSSWSLHSPYHNQITMSFYYFLQCVSHRYLDISSLKIWSDKIKSSQSYFHFQKKKEINNSSIGELFFYLFVWLVSPTTSSIKYI